MGAWKFKQQRSVGRPLRLAQPASPDGAQRRFLAQQVVGPKHGAWAASSGLPVRPAGQQMGAASAGPGSSLGALGDTGRPWQQPGRVQGCWAGCYLELPAVYSSLQLPRRPES